MTTLNTNEQGATDQIIVYSDCYGHCISPFSPIYLKSIIPIIDLKGTLEITLDNIILSYLNSER